MSQLSESVVNNIKVQHIQPIPRWRVLLQSQFVWGMVVCSVVLGAIAVAISLHLFIVPLDEVTTQPLRSHVWELLSRIPLFWLISLLIFTYVAYHNFIHTESGYRWKTFHILAGTVMVSFLFGGILFSLGIGRLVNSALVNHLPGYTQYGDMRGRMWMNPEEGRLAGVITELDSKKNTVRLRDAAGNVWTVQTSQNTVITAKLVVGMSVRIYGENTAPWAFLAFEVTPWEGRGMKMMQENRWQRRITL